MKAKLLSSHRGSDGEVVALTKEGYYVYAKELSEANTKKLLSKLAKADEIDTTHWTLEWKLETYGS